MKTVLNALLSLAALLFVSDCSSSRGPQVQRGRASEAIAQQNTASKVLLTKAEQSTRIVQVGKKDYLEGRLDSAKTLLEIAIQTDPRNNEARYWLYRVKEDMGQKQSGYEFKRPPNPPPPQPEP